MLQEEQVVVTKKTFSIWRYLPVLLAILFIAWAVVVAFATYNFTSAKAWATINSEAVYYPDIFTKLPHNLDALGFLLLFLFSAVGPGGLLLLPLKLNWRDKFEQSFFALATGLILWTFVTLGLGAAGFLQRRVFLSLLGLAFLATLWYLYRLYRPKGTDRTLRPVLKLKREFKFSWRLVLFGGLVAVLAFHLYIALLGALGPEVQFDAHHYHLGPPKHYALREQIYNIIEEDRMSAAIFTPYQQTLYTALIKMYSVIAAKLLHWADAVLVVFFLIYFCRVHFNSLLMGLLAGLIFINVPVVNWSTGTGANDLPLPFFTLLAIHAFLRWREKPHHHWRWLIVVGGMLGYTVGIKLFGGFSLALLGLALIIFSYRSRKTGETRLEGIKRVVGHGLVFGLAVLVTCLPWFIRAYTTTGNPVFPYLNGIFKSPYWTAVGDAIMKDTYLPRGVDTSPWGLLTYPWRAVVDADKLRGLLGPLFLLFLPLYALVTVLVRTPRGRLFRQLAIFSLLWGASWLATGALENRYTETILPLLAILVSFVVVVPQWSGWPGKTFQVVLGLALAAAIFFNNPLFVFFQSPDKWVYSTRATIPWTMHYRGTPENEILLPYLPMTQFINKNLSAQKDKVYDGTNLMIYFLYADIEIFNGALWEGPNGLGQWNLASPDALQRLKEAKITYLTMYVSNIPAAQNYRLWNNLQEVYRTREAEPQVLFRVNYDIEQPPAIQTFLSVTPNPVTLNPVTNTGSTTIRWNTGNGQIGQIYVSINGGADQLFAQDLAGAQVANWITANTKYVFKLYAGTDKKTLLASQTVAPVNYPAEVSPLKAGEYIVAAPNPVPINPASGNGTTTLYWDTRSGQFGQVYMSANGSAEQLVGQAASGSIQLPWIGSGVTYVFKLYAGTDKKTLIASCTVVGR